MAETPPRRTPRPPFWRDVRILRAIGQAVFIVVVVALFRELFLNLSFGLRRQGLDLDFQFLRQRAGFPIKEGISYSPNQTFVRALQVGFVNTIRVAAAGIVLASVLGLVMGVARLSTNWLVRKIAQVYVEAFRNTPVAVQIVFWYVAVVLALPAIRGGLALGDVAFLSNRGMAIPWLRVEDGAAAWGAFLLVAGALAALVWRWRTRVNERTGQPHRRVVWSLGGFLAVAAVGYAATGSPILLDVPDFTGQGYRGGFQLSPEFAALLLGLVVYTGAFIAEIVRGSILAVPKGQKEAGEAMGLTPIQQLRFVVLPQALRIAIPPINSQYLNLTKNSSLAVLIGYPELVSVGRTISNQAGRATQVLLIVMAAYLTLSLAVSFAMNLVNRAVAYRGEGR